MPIVISKAFSQSFLARFWKKVKKTNSYWLWTGATMSSGYGHINKDNQGGMIGTHRVSWVIHNGEIPDGLNVLHDCPEGDNRLCINPEHLFLGTQMDNVRDMLSKGRGGYTGSKGMANKRAILTDKQVLAIRAEYKGRGTRPTQLELSKKYKISKSVISFIINRSIWKHI